MRKTKGGTGTLLGLFLRILQTVFAGVAIKLTIKSYPDFNYNTYRYFTTSMVVQLLWSCSMAAVDMLGLVTKQRLESYTTALFIAAGDWVAGLASLGAGSVLAAIISLHGCRHFTAPCGLYQLAAAFAFFSWLATATSSLIMFWIAAGGD